MMKAETRRTKWTTAIRATHPDVAASGGSLNPSRLRNPFLLAFYREKIFLHVTQEFLEEGMPSFITLQVVPLFHLEQRNI